MRTDRLHREYGVELRWSVFPLHPETPEKGMELSELFAGREEMIRPVQERLLRLAGGAADVAAQPHLQQPAGAGAWEMGTGEGKGHPLPQGGVPGIFRKNMSPNDLVPD